MPQLAAGNSTPRASPAARFASTDLVTASAGLFHNSGAWTGAEGRRFRVTVSAGTVSVSMRDAARLERNRQDGLGNDPQLGSPVYDLATDEAQEWCKVRQVDARGRLAHVEDEQGFVVEWKLRDSVRVEVAYEDDGVTPLRVDARPQRQVTGWSRKSRARMVRTLAQLDWSPMYPDSLGYGYSLGYSDARPAVMVTLTYPGDWLTVAPNGAAVKRHLDVLRKRFSRAWGVPWVGPWKLEFQRRGAPHLHLMIVPPKGTALCRCADCACWCRLPDCGEVCGTQLRFADWLSHAWADVVGHPDPEQRRRHLLAGTGVDYLKGGRAFDPKRAAVYFSKHGGAAGGKEYQHGVPVEWQAVGSGPGRFWGYWGLEKVTADAELDLVDYLRVRRTLRRWSKANGLTRRVVSQRVDYVTGAVRYRSRRRRGIIAQGGLTGGTVLVNDGPAFASALSRLLA